MKFLWIALGSSFLVPVYGKSTLEERMVNATAQTDIPLLRKLMKRFDREHLTKEQRIKSLQLVRASCVDVVQAAEASSLITSKRDLMKSLIGGLAGVWGLSHLISYGHLIQDPSGINDHPVLFAKAVGSGVTMLSGGYWLIQGLRKTSQMQRHEASCKIDDYLESCIKEVDLPSRELVVANWNRYA